MKMIVCGDVHWKRFPNSPYNKGLDKLFLYMLEKFPEHAWIFTGDFFDDDVMHYGVITHAVKLLSKHNNKKIIVTGNHELGNYGNILAPLRYSNVEIKYEKSSQKLGDFKVTYFPYLSKLRDMKLYEDHEDELDISVAHFALPGQNFGSADEISLKCKANIAHVNGHIHLPSQNSNEFGNFVTVGVPQPTRNLEQFHQPCVVEIDENGKFSLVELPRFFTIEDVKFGELPKHENSIVNVVDAPSIDAVRAEYKDFNVREEGVKLKRTEIDIKSKVENVLHKDINAKWVTWMSDNKKSKEACDVVSAYLI